MNKYYILYNPLAGSRASEEASRELSEVFSGEDLSYVDITDIDDIKDFCSKLDNDDSLILSGGDGTLNRFVNNISGMDIAFDVLYYPTGTGNDFFHDVDSNKEDKVCKINKYLKNLPKVTVKGIEKYFLNGVGYGIDGYCCEVGDKQKETSDKPVNYTTIAIKGLLFHYKPTNAVVTVDGKEYTFKKVWMASTMKGRYYGGGMMNAPKQDRLDPEKKVSVVLFHGSGKLKTLSIFPSIFEGKHINHKETVTVITGHEVNVKYDRPSSLQIDGETILNVSEYSVTAN